MIPRSYSIVLVFLATALSISFASPITSTPVYNSEKRVEICNAAFDKVLSETFDKFLDDIEPYQGHEWSTSFNRRFLFKNWTGQLRLFDIEIDGLTDVKRISDARIVQEHTGEKILHVDLVFPRLFHTAKYGVSFAGFDFARHLLGYADNIQLSLQIVFDYKTELLELRKFKIMSMTDVHLRVDGPPAPISGIYNFIFQVVSNYAKRTQKFAIEKIFAHRISRVINDCPEADILKNILHTL